MVNKIDLLSDGEFKKIINESASSADVLRKLEYSVNGNSWAYKIIAERMQKLNIQFGKKLISNGGVKPRLELKEILIKDSNYNRTKLKDRLINEGIKEYKCECCGISSWNNKPISLQLHHINGIHNDNRLNNLQLLCPNCHSQTENFGTKGKGMVIKRKCDSLSIEDKKIIMNTVREYGIVETRKRLNYRNSLINSIVKQNHDIIEMIFPNGEIKKFSTAYEASKYMFEELNIGNNPDSCRSAISKCYCGKQKTVHGYKFIKRSSEL